MDAESSFDALQMLEKEPFQLAFIECNLPVMSGLRLLEIIRRSPKIAALPVVMLSSRSNEATIRSIAQLGVAGVLAKPLDPDILSRRLMQWAATSPASAGDHVPSDLSPQGPETILVADGDPHFRHFATDALRGGRRILQAATGAAALKLALTYRPVITLVGQNLGLLTADLLVREFRSMPALGAMRVVAVPAKSEEGTFQAEGYDGVIVRTFVPDVFRREVARLSRSIGPLTRLMAAYPLMNVNISTAVSQVCGMMMELDVSMVNEMEPRVGGTVSSSQTITTNAHQLAFRVEVTTGLPDAGVMTAKLTGLEAGQASDEDLCATVAEMVNIVTGRLRNALGEAGITAQCALPVTRVLQTGLLSTPAADDETRMYFATPDGSLRLCLSLVAAASEADLPLVA